MTALALLNREVSRTLQLLQTKNGSYIRKQCRIIIRNESSFLPRRVLIVAKVSRYHYEKLREPNLNESQLRKRLIERGSDYDALLASHHIDKEKETATRNILKQLNIEYKVMNRLSLDHTAFDWADLILPIGGDGTFLFSANLINDNKKPIMGINSDPKSSEGYLMLQEKYTKDIRSIFDRLREGEYKFLMRNRIRTTLKGEGIWNPTFHMHVKRRIPGEEEKLKVRYTDKDTAAENNNIHGFYEDSSEDDKVKSDKTKAHLPRERRLPWLALNEVFIGESLSARTSALEIKLGDENSSFKVKSCGLCASTGTGSTSWHKAINSLSPQAVNDVLRFAGIESKKEGIDVDKISAEYNKKLEFPADDGRIAYTIRDMIMGKTLPSPKGIQPRGYCEKLIIRSHCFDAGLVLDGGMAVPFNDGTLAVMEIHPEDSLRTITLPD